MSTMDETVRRARSADVTFVAASVAYYWLLSLIPMLVLAFVVVQVAYGSALADWVVDLIAPALTDRGRELVQQMFADSTGWAVVSIGGIVALAWAWFRLYHALERSFELVYEHRDEMGVTGRFLEAAVVVPAVSVALALTATGVMATGPGIFWTVVQIVGIALALFPVFVTLPPNRPALHVALVGATVTAVAWTLLRVAFDIYAAYGAYSAAYGLLGAVILLVTFLYFGAVALLFSVSLTATLEG